MPKVDDRNPTHLHVHPSDSSCGDACASCQQGRMTMFAGVFILIMLHVVKSKYVSNSAVQATVLQPAQGGTTRGYQLPHLQLTKQMKRWGQAVLASIRTVQQLPALTAYQQQSRCRMGDTEKPGMQDITQRQTRMEVSLGGVQETQRLPPLSSILAMNWTAPMKRLPGYSFIQLMLVLKPACPSGKIAVLHGKLKAFTDLN